VAKIAPWMTIVAAGLLCLAVNAQEKPAAKKKAAPAGMAMPNPGPEMKELAGLVGTWKSDETFEKTPYMPGGTGAGTSTVRLGPGGFTIIMDQRSKNAMGSFTGHGVMTWDANEKAYRFVWADSMAPGVVIETGHKDGDSIVFTGETMAMGKKLSLRDVISDRTPTSYTLTSYMNDGSGEVKTMTIKFTKQEPAAAAPAAKK
jgi:hypothetical protein